MSIEALDRVRHARCTEIIPLVGELLALCGLVFDHEGDFGEVYHGWIDPALKESVERMRDEAKDGNIADVAISAELLIRDTMSADLPDERRFAETLRRIVTLARKPLFESPCVS